MFVFLSVLSYALEIQSNPSSIYYCHSPKNMNFDRNQTKKNGLVAIARKWSKKGGPGKIKLPSWKNEITQLET